MPKPKYEPWDKAKTNQIKSKRVAAGLESPTEFSKALKTRGVDLSDQAYMRRERGETPMTVDELGAVSAVLGLTLQEAFELYSRPANDTCHS